MGYVPNAKKICKMKAYACHQTKNWHILIQNVEGDTDYRNIPFGVRIPKIAKNLRYGDLRHLPEGFPN